MQSEQVCMACNTFMPDFITKSGHLYHYKCYFSYAIYLSDYPDCNSEILPCHRVDAIFEKIRALDSDDAEIKRLISLFEAFLLVKECLYSSSYCN